MLFFLKLNTPAPFRTNSQDTHLPPPGRIIICQGTLVCQKTLVFQGQLFASSFFFCYGQNFLFLYIIYYFRLFSSSLLFLFLLDFIGSALIKRHFRYYSFFFGLPNCTRHSFARIFYFLYINIGELLVFVYCLSGDRFKFDRFQFLENPSGLVSRFTYNCAGSCSKKKQ